MENPTQPKSEPTTGTHHESKPAPTAASMPFSTTSGPLWVGLAVMPFREQDNVLHHELNWLRDINQAEQISKDRIVLTVVLERAGCRVSIDYATESFKEFIEGCADELLHNTPAWDDPAEEALTRDAVRFLSKLI